MGPTQTQLSSSSSAISRNNRVAGLRDPLYSSNGPLLAARNPGPPPYIPSQVRHTAEPETTAMTGQFRAWSASPRAQQQTGSQRRYRCNGDCRVPTCTQEFTRDSSLKRHIAEQASRNSGHPGYGCRMCASIYLRLSDLSEHERKAHPGLA
ncbi:hypothetical protein FIBSPDRAFT_157215 [Athelia psychrophila]|uniref:C2H2-type domain-containing protein n=1 Tax=Athelia psychrophila TaxID=1759441 RepID=A0A166B9V6_9AGAM|nr:hypothetical protein FIBSPDRAFT_157215 [Fibularhizoctonia sp. CBS 109695]